MQAPSGPFKILAINDYVPEKLKPWICIFFLLIMQFAGGGIYLATVNETMSERALLQEDVMMAGYASMAGMALIFTIMLRLKFRIPTKYALMVCCSALIICNIICLYTNNLFVLVATCFVAGMFRMWATFEFNSTIQLWITPKRDMPVFFSYVYLVVNGMILIGGAADLYIGYLTNVHYLNWFVIGLLLFMMLSVMLLFNSRRFMPNMPLFGIDWLGAFMWGLSMLTLNFIMIYGDFYDWLDAWQIRSAIVILVILVGLNLYRASFIRHPFIAIQTFKFRPVFQSLILYIVIDILIAPSHLIEHIYFESILGFDIPHMAQVNFVSLTGIIAGSIFVWRYFAVHKHSFKATMLIGLSAILLHLLLMYFVIDIHLSKEYLVIPLFLRNFGYVVMAVALLSDLMNVPFPNFFQSLSVQAFISAACGGAIGVAVIQRMLRVISTKNFQLLSMDLDKLNSKLHQTDANTLDTLLSQQILVGSFKEIYGYLVICAIIFFIAFAVLKQPKPQLPPAH